MNKYLCIILIFTLAQACNSASKRGEADNKRVLTVTIEPPQRYFLDQIVGDAFTINTLVPPGTSPETYEPAPSVMIEMGGKAFSILRWEIWGGLKMRGRHAYPATTQMWVLWIVLPE